MATEITRDGQQTDAVQPGSERGLMVAMLVMVVLGVAGMYAV